MLHRVWENEIVLRIYQWKIHIDFCAVSLSVLWTDFRHFTHIITVFVCVFFVLQCILYLHHLCPHNHLRPDFSRELTKQSVEDFGHFPLSMWIISWRIFERESDDKRKEKNVLFNFFFLFFFPFNPILDFLFVFYPLNLVLSANSQQSAL